MSGLATAWVLAVRRLAAHRRTSLAVAIGILLAAVVLSFVPAYRRAMADLGLRYNVTATAGESARLSTYASGLTLGGNLGPTEAWIGDSVSAQAGWFVDYEDAFLRSRTMQGVIPGGQEIDISALALQSMERRVSVVEGEFPGAMEVALAPGVAETLGVAVGDELVLPIETTDCFPPPPPEAGPVTTPPCDPSIGSVRELQFTVSGFVEPAEPDDPFWDQVNADPTRVAQMEDVMRTVYPVVFDYEFARTGLASIAPSLSVGSTLVYRADLDQISAGNADDAQSRLAALSDSLRGAEVFTVSTIDDALIEFQRANSFSSTPILILALQIAAVVILYVAIVAALLAEELVDETALLRGRGASLGQVFALAVLEGLTFAIPAAIFAPFIAAGLVTLLGYTPVFEDATGGEALPFTLTPEAFILAAGGALLATAALAIPVALSARQRFMEGRRRQARTTGRPFYQKYFLDVGVVAVAGILIFELNRQETVFEPGSFGGLSNDPLLLMAPAIFAVATAAILLRVFPIAARWAARVLHPVSGPAAELALTNLARNTWSYARLLVLLTLVFALGAFAATYSPTVDASYEDRATYAAGPDLRVMDPGRMSGRKAAEVEETFRQVDGVDDANVAWRGTGAIGNDNSVAAQVDLLAIDATSVLDSVVWRPDFAPGSDPADLFSTLDSGPEPEGLVLPGEPDSFSIDILAVNRGQMNLWIRVRDGAGDYHTLDVSKLNINGWGRYAADFSSSFTLSRGDGIAYPLSIVSIYFTEPEGFFRPSQDPLLLDRIAVIEDGVETVVESFESGDLQWERFSDQPNIADTVAIATVTGGPDGTRAMEFATDTGRAPGKRGVYFMSIGLPIAGLASNTFVLSTGAGPGTRIDVVVGQQTVPIVITGVLELFPTLDPAGRGFLVFDAESLFGWSKVVGEDPQVLSEVWVDTASTGSEAVEVALRTEIGASQIVNREEEIHEQTSNPIVSAGASGLLGFGFVAAFSVLCLAVVLTLVLDAERRTVSTSVLRAVGLSSRSVLVALVIEYMVVLVLGMVLGVVLGLQVGELMLQFLEVTETGDPVLPPFVLETDWQALGAAMVALAVVTIGSILAAGLYLRRVSIARAVRLSE